MRAALAPELAELRRILRHYRPFSRLLRATAEFSALMLFVGGIGAVALGYVGDKADAPPVMLVEAR